MKNKSKKDLKNLKMRKTIFKSLKKLGKNKQKERNLRNTHSLEN